MTTELTTYEMPARNARKAIEAIEAANRKAARAGLDERIAYSIERYDLEISINYIAAVRPTAAITISRPTIKIEGWTFLGAIEYDAEAGAIVRTVPGAEIQIRPEAAACDHCHTTRARSTTYVLRNEAGETKQIGSSCIQAYLGIRPAALWMLTWDAIEAAAQAGADEDEDGDDRGGSTAIRYSTAKILILTAAIVDMHGWTSSKQAEQQMKTSTAARVKNYLRTKPETTAEKEEAAKIKALMQEDRIHAIAAEAHQAAREITGITDYANNMIALAHAATVSGANIGYLASAYALMLRNREQAAAAAASNSKHLGKIGDRITVTGATVKSLRTSEGFYGITTLIIFADAEGNALKWFASGNQPHEIGEIVTLTGTIKAHEQYNGINETILTRCKIK